MRPLYATYEDVAAATDSQETARNTAKILRRLEAGASSVEGLCKRVFYPWTGTRYADWPPLVGGTPSWIFRLTGRLELAELTALSSGGTTIPISSVNLEPNDEGAPYTRLEIQLSSNSFLSSGSTFQRSLAITGTFMGAPLDERVVTTLAAIISSTSSTTITLSASDQVGIGSIIKVDSERMLVTAKNLVTTGQSLIGTLSAAKTDQTVNVASGAAIAVDEVITLDSERMRVVDIVGNALTVERAVNGSALATHNNGTVIYARRLLTVERGALGTTAATHSNGASVYLFRPPALVSELNLAEAVVNNAQMLAGWARTVGTGENQREARGGGLRDLRDRCFAAHGRKGRTLAI